MPAVHCDPPHTPLAPQPSSRMDPRARAVLSAARLPFVLEVCILHSTSAVHKPPPTPTPQPRAAFYDRAFRLNPNARSASIPTGLTPSASSTDMVQQLQQSVPNHFAPPGVFHDCMRHCRRNSHRLNSSVARTACNFCTCKRGGGGAAAENRVYETDKRRFSQSNRKHTDRAILDQGRPFSIHSSSIVHIVINCILARYRLFNFDLNTLTFQTLSPTVTIIFRIT